MSRLIWGFEPPDQQFNASTEYNPKKPEIASKKKNMHTTPFHLAFPVKNLAETRNFYEGLLGCEVGRTADRWIDFNFWGHQISAHLTEQEMAEPQANPVDGKKVPIKHFGAILPMDQWEDLARKVTDYGVEFIIEPYVRFKGEVGEQATMFFFDPSGNALEFKSFQDFDQIFAPDVK